MKPPSESLNIHVRRCDSIEHFAAEVLPSARNLTTSGPLPLPDIKFQVFPSLYDIPMSTFCHLDTSATVQLKLLSLLFPSFP